MIDAMNKLQSQMTSNITSFCMPAIVEAYTNPRSAEEVEKIDPGLVARDDEGKVYAVRYEAVNAMMLNEFLKEHRKVQEQQATIACLKNEFKSKFAQQQKQIEALTAGLEKVTTRVEAANSVTRVVSDN